MKPSTRLHLAAGIAAVLLLALSWRLRSWGGVALVLATAGGYAWYRAQVVRGEAAEQFFTDPGEDTRMTGFQGGSPSELGPLAPDEEAGSASHR